MEEFGHAATCPLISLDDEALLLDDRVECCGRHRRLACVAKREHAADRLDDGDAEEHARRIGDDPIHEDPGRRVEHGREHEDAQEAADDRGHEDGEEVEAPQEPDSFDDEFDGGVSLSAMEAELKPQVLSTFDTIADSYKKLRKLQDQQVEARLACAGTLSSGQERRYKELKDQLITAVKSLSLNQNRIDSLVEQLYDISKRLMQNEGRLLRLAESYGVKREAFLEQYQGAELDPNWMKSVANLSGRGWKEFAKNENTMIRNIRAEMNVAPSVALNVLLKCDAKDAQRAGDNEAFLKSLARLESIRVLADGEVAPLSVKKLIGATELMIPMAGLIDKDAELARLAKEVARLVGECGRIEGKLGNEAFVAKAPEAVIAKEREKLEDYRLQLTKLEAQQAEIAAL